MSEAEKAAKKVTKITGGGVLVFPGLVTDIIQSAIDAESAKDKAEIERLRKIQDTLVTIIVEEFPEQEFWTDEPDAAKAIRKKQKAKRKSMRKDGG